jgi:sarcosine/dimethylglycine N-methyltransferase
VPRRFDPGEERIRLTYDRADDIRWQRTVYEPVHAGWAFANIGGSRALDAIAQFAKLGSGSRVLELCSGLGETCAYLASTFGCHVTGVEGNRVQFRRCQARIRARFSSIRKRLRFLREDVLHWQSPHLFDAVYTIDSLMLLAQRDAALTTCHRVLAQGGRLVTAEVFAGPRISAYTTRTMWTEDGVRSLPSAREQRARLGELGFAGAAITDMTDQAVDCFTRISEATRENESELVASVGRRSFVEWMRSADFYRRAFARRALTYHLVTAMRPG